MLLYIDKATWSPTSRGSAWLDLYWESQERT